VTKGNILLFSLQYKISYKTKHLMQACSLVPSQDVLPLINAVIQINLQYGYDKQSIVNAVREAFTGE